MAPPKDDIDGLDRKIILELQKDGRRTYQVIGKKLKVSEGTVRKRVLRLIEKGILHIQAMVNPFAFQHKVAALVAVTVIGKESKKTMETIAKIPCVTSLWSATGRYDFFFELMVDSLDELNEVVFVHILREVEGISRTETFVTLTSENKLYKLS